MTTDSDDMPYRVLFDESPDPMMVFDAKTLMLLEVNRAASRHYGYSREELLSMRVADLRPPDDASRFVAWFTGQDERARRVPHHCARTWRHRKKDGTIIEVEVWRAPIVFGGVDAFVEIVRDVTERRRYEEEIGSREKRFRALLENMSDAIAMIGPDARILYTSPSGVRQFGYEDDEIRGMFCFDLIHPEDRALVVEKFGALLGMPQGSVRAEYRVIHRNGTHRWVEGVATNMLHEPAVNAIVANFRDVSERKQAEVLLRESEERYRLLFEASPLPIFVYDCETLRVVAVNNAAVRLYGHSVEEFLQLTIRDIRPPEDIPLLDAALAGGPASGRHVQGALRRHRRRDGVVIDVEISSHPITFDGRRARLVVVLDVTEKRRLEEQLRQSQKMEAIGLLAGGVAHDFNNLLSIILGATELAARSAKLGQPVSQHLEDVNAAATRAAELTRKLLALSRQQVLRMQTVDLREVIDDFCALLSRILGEDVELVLRKAERPLHVRADVTQLQQVLLNLCTNARQAMPRGGRLVLETRYRLTDASFVARNPWATEGSFAELVVADSGEGMSTETMARMFEPFFTTKEQGSGLGLAIVYGIVQQHGGRVSVDSAVGEGTQVHVLLPLVAAPEATEGTPRKQEELRGGRETLLVAEDEAPLRRLLASTLTNMGYEVLVAEDGEEAVKVFESRRGEVDLVILDVVMPKLGGPETYARMKALNPKLRVLFTSGYAPDHVRVAELVTSQGHALLDKPFHLNQLTARVREVLDR